MLNLFFLSVLAKRLAGKSIWLVLCRVGRETVGRISYIRISLCYLFPVKYGKLSTGINAQRFLSCYG